MFVSNLVMFRVYSFILTFSSRAPDPEQDSASVQEFLENMEGAFRAHTPWAGSSEEELESAGEVIALFCSATIAFVCIQNYRDRVQCICSYRHLTQK